MVVKKKRRGKIRDTFSLPDVSRIGGKIVLSICLHRVFKMQSPIRLSISPPASFRVYSSLFPLVRPCEYEHHSILPRP